MNNDFLLPKYGYLAFDALSMKSLIKERLNKAGVFTDQNYEGSNISQIIDIFAYTFHTLIYYMNKTASEGMFTDSKIYENLNRIVKSLGYNPIGCQTPIVSYQMTVNSGYNKVFQTDNSIYFLPRYSSINDGKHSFIFTEDISFSVTENQMGKPIEDFENKNFLYEGTLQEYPEIVAEGNENEIVFLNPGKNVLIDHFTIDVYVKHNNKWSKWEKTPSLYLNNAGDEVYEIRLNDAQYYEIKFGNNICGKQLNAGDIVQIYYIQSSGSDGTVGEGGLTSKQITLFSSDRFTEILNDTHFVNANEKQVDFVSVPFLKILSNTPSTYFTEKESVEDIRDNAPGIFRTQYRLVTSNDFKNYILTNYTNLVHDIKVVNNQSYLQQYIKYYYDLGLSNPNNDARVLLNQVMFSDACNFNNVYMFAVPKIPNSNNSPMNFMSPALKSMILQDIQSIKVLTCEPIILDPIYMKFSLAMPEFGSKLSLDDKNLTKLVIKRKYNSKRDSASIKSDITSIFQDYFNLYNQKLGQEINLAEISRQILSVDGVDSYYITRDDNRDLKINGLSFYKINPIYPTDVSQITANITLEPYQFAFLDNDINIMNQIEVENASYNFELIEY